MPDSADPQPDDDLGWMRITGVGFELAGSVLVLGGLGYWLDQHAFWQGPWGFVGGGLLGFALGMVSLFRLSQKYNR